MQVVGDEPSHFRERRPGATGGKGFEGERSIPSPEPNVAHVESTTGAVAVGGRG